MPAPREGRRWGLGVGAPPVRKGGKLLTRGEGWGGDRTLCVVTRRRLLASAVCAVVACSVRVIRADLLAIVRAVHSSLTQPRGLDALDVHEGFTSTVGNDRRQSKID